MYECPVCHYIGLEVRPYRIWPPPQGLEISPPYEKQLGAPSYEVCRRCGFEFGNDDNPGGDVHGDSFEEYRQAWIAAGQPIFHVSAKPEDGEASSQ